MKIETIVEPTESGATLMLVAQGEKASWLYLRWQEEANALVGCFATPSDTGLANGRLVRLNAAEGLDRETIGTFALGCFIAASGVPVTREGNKIVDDRDAKMDAWAAFLNDGNKAAANKKAPIASIEINEAQELMLRQGRFLSPPKQNSPQIIVRRDNPIILGLHMTGFDMLSLQNRMSKIFPNIAPPPDLDIKAARAALGGAPRPSSSAVAWFGEKSEHAKDRLQVSQVYPMLAGMIGDIPALRAAVDNRESIQEKLIEATGLSKGAFKRLSKIKSAPAAENLFEAEEDVHGVDALGVNRERHRRIGGGASLNTILGYLAKLPPDRCPQDEKSWEQFQDILTKMAIPLENAIGLPVEKTLAACKGDWAQFHATLAKAADFAPEDFSDQALGLTTIDAIEAIEDMTTCAVLPLMLNTIQAEGQDLPHIEREYYLDARKVAINVALGKNKNPAAGILEIARRYASRIPALKEASGKTDLSTEAARDEMAELIEKRKENYFPLMPDYLTKNGKFVITQLRSDAEMAMESDRLTHCVGHYYLTQAMRADCHILSIENPDKSKSYATIEIARIKNAHVSKDGRHLIAPRNVQFRAKSNANPDPDYQDALNEFLQACSEKEVELLTPIAVMDAWGEKENAYRMVNRNNNMRKAPSVTWSSVLGYDWRKEDVTNNLWTECSYIMGADWGKSDNPGIIWKESEARKLISNMSPQTGAILEQRAREERAARELAKKMENAPDLAP